MKYTLQFWDNWCYGSYANFLRSRHCCLEGTVAPSLTWMFAVNLPYEINPKKDFMCSVLMRSAVIHDIYTIKSSLSLYPPPTKWRRPTDWFNILLTNCLRHVSLMSLAAVSLIHIVRIWETETLRVQTIWYPYRNAETSDVSSLADCESDRLSCKLKVTVWVHVSS